MNMLIITCTCIYMYILYNYSSCKNINSYNLNNIEKKVSL